MNHFLKTRRQKRRENLFYWFLALFMAAAVFIVGSFDYDDQRIIDNAKQAIFQTGK